LAEAVVDREDFWLARPALSAIAGTEAGGGRKKKVSKVETSIAPEARRKFFFFFLFQSFGSQFHTARVAHQLSGGMRT
jgi:hypothetical protein